MCDLSEVEVNFRGGFFVAMCVCALGCEKQTSADSAGKGCPLALSAVWTGFQWPGAVTGITLQLLGPDCKCFGERKILYFVTSQT